MHKLVFFVPESHLNAVKHAVFDAGAGKIGNYDRCSWEVLGRGQFRPLAGSRPYLGKCNKLEVAPEYRVEMVCSSTLVDQVIAALRGAHPYEEPAFDLWCLDEQN